MTALLVFIAFLAALGIASALGWTTDSRDTNYGFTKGDFHV
jgi:hypothetical protein